MATTRRQLLSLAVLAAFRPAIGASRPLRVAAAWERDGQFEVGVLRLRGGAWRREEAIPVPTRAHGLLQQSDGSLVAVARRPGDWLLRWKPGAPQAAQWCWLEPGSSLNGHACASADGRALFTTETDHESGQGRIAVRDAASLRKQHEWPTHGADPHELLRDAAGDLWVANGGIATAPETGRAKLDLATMDSSLVQLDGRSGALEGQWRLQDRRLGLRHLAWGASAGGKVLGIALQAEHEADAERHAAPVLALWHEGRLRTVPGRAALKGYGGDVAYTGGRFAVSCPRGDGVLLVNADGEAPDFLSLPGACALAAEPLWIAGTAGALGGTAATQHAGLDGLRLDNHWLLLP